MLFNKIWKTKYRSLYSRLHLKIMKDTYDSSKKFETIYNKATPNYVLVVGFPTPV